MTVDYQLDRADFLAFSKSESDFAPESLSPNLLLWNRAGHRCRIGNFRAVISGRCDVYHPFPCVRLVYHGPDSAVILAKPLYSDENLSFSTRLWTVKLSDEGLRISSDAAEVCFIAGLSSGKCLENSRYLLFEITPLRQVHVPIRAFRDEEHIQQRS